MRQTSKLSVFSCCMLSSVWSVYDTEWAHRNWPCSNKTLNTPSKHQEAMLVSKGRGSHVYLISSFVDMVLTLIVTFGLRNSALDCITEGVLHSVSVGAGARLSGGLLIGGSRRIEQDSRLGKHRSIRFCGQRTVIYASSIRRGSSMYSLIFTRNCTASLPSSIRWSYVRARYII
jgi:hypothetical protein